MSGSRIAPAPTDGSPRGERGGAFLKRAEVRDLLAWLRLLADPQDAAAVVRALARPPIELRQVELARVIQVARRRKNDLVVGLAAATESPQVPPEARERIQRFLELHRSAAAQLGSVAPDVFVGWLIQRLGVRGRPLLGPEDAAEQRAGLEALHGLAVDFVRGTPGASIRDLARHLATVVPDGLGEGRANRVDRVIDRPTASAESPAADGEPLEMGDTAGDGDLANADLEDQEPGEGEPELTDEGPVDELHATFQLLREEVLEGVARIGGRLGELRLDTDLDISHGVVRYLELLKLSALLQRPEGQDLADALADVNARLLAAATPLQREILQTSTLDHTLGGSRDRDGEGSVPRSASVLVPEPSRPASSTRSVPSCRARASASRCPRRTSTPTAAVRCATSTPASCASPPSRPSTSASASSCTRCSSATTRTAVTRSRRCSRCSTPVGGGRGSVRVSAIASCWRRRALRCTRYQARLAARSHGPCGSSANSTFAWGHTTCAGGSIASIGLAAGAASGTS